MRDENPDDARPFPGLAAAVSAPFLRFQCLRIETAAAAMTLVCGCVSYSPQPIDLFHEIEQLEQRASETHELEVVAPGSAEWLPLEANIDLTDGLDLAEANALALFYAPEIREARSAERVSAAQLFRAGLLSNPQLFLGPRVSTKDDDVIFPAWLSWELPLWGKQDAEKDLANRQLSAVQLRVIETELRVLTELRSRFVQITYLTGALQSLEAQLRGGERVLEWVAALEQAGEVDAVTVYLARLEQDEARATLSTTRLQLDSITRALLETVGMLPDAPVSLALDVDPAQLPDVPPPDRDRLLRHPEIRAALADYEAAEVSLRLEIAQQYPTIRVGPEFEDDRGDSTIGVGVGIELPLFDRNRGGIVEAEERRDAARERMESSLLRLSHADAQARAEWSAAERVLGEYRAGALEIAERARASLELRLQAGQSNVLEVLAALRALTRARVRELELESESAVARFRAAVAGGAVLNDPTENDSESEER